MSPAEQNDHTHVYLGIDPGAGGGIAVLMHTYVRGGPAFESSVSAVSMPPTLGDIWQQLGSCGNHTKSLWSTFAVIEKVGGFLRTEAPNPGSAMFKFGVSYGSLLMALTAAGVPYEEVTPQRWQKALGVPSRKKGETKGGLKNRLKARAQQLFPSEKVTLATADALLLAEYCRRWRGGLLHGQGTQDAGIGRGGGPKEPVPSLWT